MNGIEKITARIQADAEEEIRQIQAQAQEQVESILKQGEAQAAAAAEDILRRGEKAAQERRERLESAAHMEARKLKLAAKQELLEAAFDQALQNLCAMPDQEYIELLRDLAVQVSETGREQLVFSQKDRNRIGKQVVMGANERLVKERAPELPSSVAESKVGAFLGRVVNSTTAMVTGTGLLTLSEEIRPIQGGFIMVDGDVEMNCAFETLVRLQRDKLEQEIAGILFA